MQSSIIGKTMFSAKFEFEKQLLQKRIFITGHTGFTGSWVCMWLKSIGIDFAGFSLPPDTNPSLFEKASISEDGTSTFGDICDYEKLFAAMDAYQPDLVLHLAAQPLVRRSFRQPIRTYTVNTLGTVHVLEAARSLPSVRGVLCVTTDKVYKNNEWDWSYREIDTLGGKDPYSASKSAAEMVIQSYMNLYAQDNNTNLAVARGGNIVGGGDWSEDRLVPDFARAVTGQETLEIRFPDAVRPWQHVLALVQGYLLILANIATIAPPEGSQAWNLGPNEGKDISVGQILDLLSDAWTRPKIEIQPSAIPEAKTLKLDSSKARNELGWIPAWDIKKTIEETAAWYREFYVNPNSAREITVRQIQAWRAAISK